MTRDRIARTAQVGFDSAFAAVKNLGDLPHAVVLEVIEGDHLCLTRWQTTYGFPERFIAFLQFEGGLGTPRKTHQRLCLAYPASYHRRCPKTGDSTHPSARRVIGNDGGPTPKCSRERILGGVL